AEILDHDIGLLSQLEEDLLPLGGFQIERQTALVAVQVLEIGTVAAAAGGVGMLTRGLDLDHIGAPISELAHRGRAGAMGSQIDDLEAVERQGGRRHLGISPQSMSPAS